LEFSPQWRNGGKGENISELGTLGVLARAKPDPESACIKTWTKRENFQKW
jgi:hypothetical protein